MQTILFKTFLNAWRLAVAFAHNQEMEYLNNPTPEVVYVMLYAKNKLFRLHKWSSKRWGKEKIADAIYFRQFGKLRDFNEH